MDLGEFKAELKLVIRRGDSMDDLIPGFIRQAAFWLERNRTMNYMLRFGQIEVDPDATDTPRYIELDNTRIKSIPMFRWINSDGSYSNLTKKDPRDMTVLEAGVPAFYWLSGVSTIVLSGTPDEVLNGELWVARYSAWPISDDATHWLLDNGEDVLQARSMINFAKHIRDPELREHWKAVFDESLVGFYAAEDELAWENSDIRMEYRGENHE
jgi:hypothetical protein